MGEWECECETAVRVGRSEGNKADEWIEKVLPLNYPRIAASDCEAHIIYRRRTDRSNTAKSLLAATAGDIAVLHMGWGVAEIRAWLVSVCAR